MQTVRLEYHHCEQLVESLAAMKIKAYDKYQKKIKQLTKRDLLIIDDFLLHSITDEREVKVIIPRFEHTWAAVQRTRTAHWIICLNPLISSCSNHSSLSMVKPYGGVKRPIDRSVRLEQMANKRIKAMC